MTPDRFDDQPEPWASVLWELFCLLIVAGIVIALTAVS